jgi:hypothetical protein
MRRELMSPGTQHMCFEGLRLLPGPVETLSRPENWMSRHGAKP